MENQGEIYRKIAAKNITKADIDKYEFSVSKFVKKFGKKQLSSWEIRTWQQKFVKKRNDALDAPFDELLFNNDLNDASSHEKINDGIRIHDN